MMPLIKSKHPKSSLLGKLLTFWFYLWRQKRSERQKFSQQRDFWRSDITYGVKKDQNVKSLTFSDFQCSFHQSYFWRSDQTFDVLIFLTFDVLIFLKKLSMFWPFDVLIFDVPTPSLQTIDEQERNRYVLTILITLTTSATSVCINDSDRKLEKNTFR